MKLQVIGDTSANELAVNEAIFGCDYVEPLVHQVVVAYMAGARQGSVAQKTRSEVSGGGRKPWRQKGTGHARAGTIRSPLWRGGGKIFAAKPRNYQQKVNRKMYRKAIKVILSELARQERLIILDNIDCPSGKTKDMVAQMKAWDLPENALFVSVNPTETIHRATQNLPYVAVADVKQLNPLVLIRYERVVMTVAAVKAIEEWLA